MSTHFDRWQKPNLILALESRRVVLLTGSRQCGKTTLAKEIISKNIEYRTLDDLTLRKSAASDPHGFVKHSKQTLIIDEIQRVPELLPAIKKVVDENAQFGQFLLTGSTNIQAMPSAQESLAGRITKLRLRPLSIGEQKRNSSNFLALAFRRKFELPTEHYDKNKLIQLACSGGYPEAQLLNERQRKRWHKDYISALIERDLMEISRIHRIDQMKELVVILAAWSSKLMNSSQIGSRLSLHKQALSSYINALEALYIVDRVKPWLKTDYERISKQDKLFMSDSGLMASLLGWNIKNVHLDSDRCGKLIETLACTELSALVDKADGEYELRHYRDRQKREIDFIVEREDGAMLGIEIKSGTNIGKKDFKHMQWFKENLTNNNSFTGIILYSGEKVAPFGSNMYAVPFGMLFA